MFHFVFFFNLGVRPNPLDSPQNMTISNFRIALPTSKRVLVHNLSKGTEIFLQWKNYWSAQKPVLASDFDWCKKYFGFRTTRILHQALGGNRSTGLDCLKKVSLGGTVLLPEPEKPFHRYCYFVVFFLEFFVFVFNYPVGTPP